MNLLNNSNEMKTIVETFIIEETADLIYDNEKLDRWNKLVNDLELKGQTTLVKPEKSPIPFMFMKESMVAVFKTLCPRSIDVKKYDITPIPVEILDLVALSKKEQYFNKIEIWYDEKAPDPLCVGITCLFYGYENGKRTVDFKTEEEVSTWPNGTIYQTDLKRYLIGKWADVKHSFEELKEIARNRYIDEQTVFCKDMIKRYERDMDDLLTTAFNKFN